MSDIVQSLTFLSWVRDGLSGLATGQAGGRAQGSTQITLTATTPDGNVIGTRAREIPFLLAGPGDVTSLGEGAIIRRYPSPGTRAHESDRCPYVELADPSFPWRYTPTSTPGPSGANLHPWLVLVVGEEGSELTLSGQQVTIEASVQGGEHFIGTPAMPYRYAHVQVDGAGNRTARVLCGRPLEPATDYLAVVVPAFDDVGAPSWTGASSVTVPAYDAWRFATGEPAGSFEDLAARLRPGGAPLSAGRASVRYPRVADAPELVVLGALFASSPESATVEEPLPSTIESDLAQLRFPARDPEGRPILGLPRYGEAWSPTAPEDTNWGRNLNRDPRRRGVAGLGLEVGIRFQEELVTDALIHLGDLREARQRVRDAVMGIAASRSLWARRVPNDPVERLWFLGPALSRLATESASIGDQATAEDRALARGTWSAAARRVLRAGPARSALAASTLPAAEVLHAANRLPPPVPSTIDGIPLDGFAMADFERARRRGLQVGQAPTSTLLAVAADLVNGSDARLRPLANQILLNLQQTAQSGGAVPWAKALSFLAASDTESVGSRRHPEELVRTLSGELDRLRRDAPEHADPDLAGLLAELSELAPGDPPVSQIGLGALASGVSDAFDPTISLPPVAVRVLETISGGIDPQQPLAPPEPCVSLDRAAWFDVQRMFEEWLLPGVGLLPENSVVPLETNPVFIDAFLLGLNSQLLAELRWRNVPIATGCTPILRFWDRADDASGARADDIVGVESWGDTGLGDSSHLAAGASGRELVIAVRSELFLRYPTTFVYLKSAQSGTPPVTSFEHEPDRDSPRLLPGFQGRFADDTAFFGFPGLGATTIGDYWVVFEEPPAGYRFANDVESSVSTGHEWARLSLAQPVRVLIRGDSLKESSG